MSGGCDFHTQAQGDCVHCLGFELALARAEVARLHGWIVHLVGREGRATNLLVACRDWFESPGGDPDSSELLDRINDLFSPSWRCRYCGAGLPTAPTDDPRSQECSICLADAHGYPEGLTVALERAGWQRRGGVGVRTTWIEP